MMVCGESEACCSVLIQTFHACGSCLCNARMGIKSRVIQSEPRIKPQKSPPNEISKPTPKTLKSAVMARISTGRPIMSECLSRTVVFLSFGFDGVMVCLPLFGENSLSDKYLGTVYSCSGCLLFFSLLPIDRTLRDVAFVRAYKTDTP